MKAKFVFEALSDVFAPKSKEEIKKGIEERYGDLSPEALLGAGIARQSVPMVELSIERGAKNWLETYGIKNSAGNIWKIFNSGGNKDIAQQMIILGLETPILINEWKTNYTFRISILKKTIYMEFTKVMEYLLNSEKEKDINPVEAENALESSLSDWADYPKAKAKKMLEVWLSKKLGKNESLGNILRPKSEEEIKGAVKNMSFEEWKDNVTDAITDYLMRHDLNSPLEGEEIKGGEEEYEKGIPPPTLAMKIIEDYFENNWRPQGGMALSNTGGIEIRINDSGDGVEYRFTGEIIPHSAEIKYDYQYDEDQEDAYFEDDHGNKWSLGDFMRM